MQLHLNFQDKEPIYAQLVEQVKSLVAAGALRPGEQLPTVRELAADLRINFNTVARAYRLLHEEQIISTQQGRGTYVLGSPGAALSDLARAERLAGMVKGWLAEAARLGYQPGEVERTWNECFTAWTDTRTV
jgi:GntR family transcriptional regulator